MAITPSGLAAPDSTGLSTSTIRAFYTMPDGPMGPLMNGAVTDWNQGQGQTIVIVDAYDTPGLVSTSDPAYSSSDLHQFDSHYSIDESTFTFTKIKLPDGATLPGVDPKGDWERETALDVEWAHAIAPKANIILLEAIDTSYLFDAVDFARTIPGVSAISMSWSASEQSTETSVDSLFTTPAGHTPITFIASVGDHGSPARYPAASPNVLAIGGTTLTLSGSNYTESTWNNLDGQTGGGVSSYESMPSYQQGVVPSTITSTNRATPDVAFDAGGGVWIYDSYNNANSPGNWESVVGTSIGAPVWAGMIALANQGRSINGLGTLDGRAQTLPLLYSAPSVDFHDVTTGNNGTYSALAAYDLVTGRGTPFSTRLITDLGNNGFNFGFETDGLDGWTPVGSVSLDRSSLTWHGGIRSALLSPAAGGSGISQIIKNLQPNTTYVLSGFAKVSTSGNGVAIGVKNYGGTEISVNVGSTSWSQGTVTFTTGPSSTTAEIYAYSGSFTGTITVDDFGLARSYSLTPSFETGGLQPWSQSYGSVSVTGTTSHVGSYAAQLTTAAGPTGAVQTVTGLQPNTTYVLSGFAKVGTSGNTVWIGAKNFGRAEVAVSVNSTSWTQGTVTFTTGPSSTTADIYAYFGSGTGTVYADDLTVVRAKVQNAGFETGSLQAWASSYGSTSVTTSTTHSGSYAVQITTATGPAAAQQTITGLLPNTTYVLSGFAKVGTSGNTVWIGALNFGGAQVAVGVNSTNWTQGSVTFTTGPTSTSADIYVFFGSGTGAVYADDLIVTQV